MIDKEKIGIQLRELRMSRGWTQAHVADTIGLSRPAISNIESGRRALTLDTLKKFCELYNIDIAYFGMDVESFSEEIDITTRVERIFKSDLDEKKKERLYLYITKLYLDSKE